MIDFRHSRSWVIPKIRTIFKISRIWRPWSKNMIKVNEIYESICVVDQMRKRNGLMFLGSFFSLEIGSCPIWEDEFFYHWWRMFWENFTFYPWHVLTMIWLTSDARQCSFSPGYPKNSRVEKEVAPIEWPPYSPDLNRIKHVWKLMKNSIQIKYPDLSWGRQRS